VVASLTELVISTQVHSDERGMGILPGDLLLVFQVVGCLPLSDLSSVLRFVHKLVM
jgi:hypothetical protein